MSALRAVTFSKLAKDDFADILLYTRNTWGEEQRDTYRDLLLVGIQRLSGFSELGQSRDDIAAGIRILCVEQHNVFYRVTTRSIRVVRIRHVKERISRLGPF